MDLEVKVDLECGEGRLGLIQKLGDSNAEANPRTESVG